MAKRSGKFYFRNEKEVMKKLGFNPTPGSGSGWVHKEDGENEYLLAQLKSTDANSYRINLLDIEKLEHHANTAHKLPVFVIEFLQTGGLYILVKPEDFAEVNVALQGLVPKIPDITVGTDELEVDKEVKVKSDPKAREKFWKQREEEVKKRCKRK